MDWKYFFAHDWTEDRTTWEDVHLHPVDHGHQGDSCCVTVDAIGAEGNACYSAEENAASHEKLRDSPYHFDSQQMKMIVRSADFSRTELIDWIRVYLEDSGYAVGRLIEGTYEEFRGTNSHSRRIMRGIQRSQANHYDRQTQTFGS